MTEAAAPSPHSTTIKISYDGEMRRIPLSAGHTFERFVEQTRSCFPSLPHHHQMAFSYIDDENENVLVSSDLEFQEALTTMITTKNSYPRFEVRPLFSGSSSAACAICHLSLHEGGGIVFQCSARNSYELCQTCEGKTTHPFPMIKFYSTSARPRPKITVTNLNSNGLTPSMHSTSATSSAERNKESLHVGIRCNECGVCPIAGTRYKCSERHDYDLCAHCEGRRDQPFPMVKIYSPDQGGSGLRISNPDAPIRFSSEESSIHCEIDLNQGLEILHHILPNFPTEDPSGRGLFNLFCQSRNRGEGCCSQSDDNCNKPNGPDLESQQIDEDILNSILQESLESISSPPQTSPPRPAFQSSTPARSDADSASRSEEETWSRELGLLRAMGFVNHEALLPLLKEHLGTPINQGFPNPEKMQHLIFSLLSNI